MRTLGWLSILAGCAPEVPDRYLAIDGREGEYGLTEVEIPELEDPFRMTGSLGDGSVGGYLSGNLFQERIDGYAGGSKMRLEYVVRDGVGVPLEQDGLILWSYYRTLSSFRAELEDVGVDTDRVFPVPFAYQPSLGGILLTSNAAYIADTVHLFVLLPDGGGDGLPLAANPGVIRHEFGHALFQSIVGGGVGLPTPAILLPEVSALNEGFADMVASLALDDPDFIKPSVDLGGIRDVSGDHTLAGTDAPDTNPYSRGTVYAAFTWDLRVLTDDPEFTLAETIASLEDWASQSAWEDGQDGVDRFAGILADRALAQRPGLESELCGAHAQRFPGVIPPARCP